MRTMLVGLLSVTLSMTPISARAQTVVVGVPSQSETVRPVGVPGAVVFHADFGVRRAPFRTPTLSPPRVYASRGYIGPPANHSPKRALTGFAIGAAVGVLFSQLPGSRDNCRRNGASGQACAEFAGLIFGVMGLGVAVHLP